jgi:hypothetical protein
MNFELTSNESYHLSVAESRAMSSSERRGSHLRADVKHREA